MRPKNKIKVSLKSLMLLFHQLCSGLDLHAHSHTHKPMHAHAHRMRKRKRLADMPITVWPLVMCSRAELHSHNWGFDSSVSTWASVFIPRWLMQHQTVSSSSHAHACVHLRVQKQRIANDNRCKKDGKAAFQLFLWLTLHYLPQQWLIEGNDLERIQQRRTKWKKLMGHFLLVFFFF